MKTIVLNSIEDVFEYGVSAIFYEDNDIVFSDSFDFSFRVYGNRWFREINYKLADYIIAQQKEILRIYNNFWGDKINLATLEDIDNRLKISYEVFNGSLMIKAKVASLLNAFATPSKNIVAKVVDKMTGRQLMWLLIIYLIVIAFGDFGKEYLRNCRHEISENKSEKIRNLEINAINNAMNIVSENSKSIIEIIKYMRDGDKISIGGRLYTIEEAKYIYGKECITQQKEETVYCDGIYTVDKPHIRTQDIYISKGGGRERPASIKYLSNGDKQLLFKHFSEAAQKDSTVAFDLNVNVYIQGGKVRNLSIVGINKPRAGSLSLDDVIEKYGYDPKQNLNIIKYSKPLLDIIEKEKK